MEHAPRNAKPQPFLAYLRDAASRQRVAAMLESRGWPTEGLVEGDLQTACAQLKTIPSPGILLVELDEALPAPQQLDALAAVCDPRTKVMVTGKKDEFSFYNWLMEIGIAEYFLQPIDPAKLDTAVTRLRDGSTSSEKRAASLIAVMGARGGNGASTVATNLAWLCAQGGRKVALIDGNFQWGTAALMLDIEASNGLREALEKPDRVDELFLDRVMSKIGSLSVLAGEEMPGQPLKLSPNTAEALLSKIRPLQDVVICDLPRQIDPFIEQVLGQADRWLLVAEPSLTALRDVLRLKEAATRLQLPVPEVVINKVGQAARFEMPRVEFEKGIESKIRLALPYEPLCLKAAMEGRLVADLLPKSKWTAGLTKLAESLVEPPASETPAAPAVKKAGIWKR